MDGKLDNTSQILKESEKRQFEAIAIHPLWFFDERTIFGYPTYNYRTSISFLFETYFGDHALISREIRLQKNRIFYLFLISILNISFIPQLSEPSLKFSLKFTLLNCFSRFAT